MIDSKGEERAKIFALIKQVISDESLHVHYGVEALRDYYTKECPEYVRCDREDWAYEMSIISPKGSSG